MIMEFEAKDDIIPLITELISDTFASLLTPYSESVRDNITENVLKSVITEDFIKNAPWNAELAHKILDGLTVRLLATTNPDVEILHEFLEICEITKKSREKTKLMIAEIGNIKGNKIITVTATDLNSSFDMTDNKIENISENEFFDRMAWHMFLGSGCIVRQFLKTTYQSLARNGKMMDMPHKNLYGIQMKRISYEWLPEEDVFECHMRDHKTGGIREKEVDVNCCSYNQQSINGN